MQRYGYHRQSSCLDYNALGHSREIGCLSATRRKQLQVASQAVSRGSRQRTSTVNASSCLTFQLKLRDFVTLSWIVKVSLYKVSFVSVCGCIYIFTLYRLCPVYCDGINNLTCCVLHGISKQSSLTGFQFASKCPSGVFSLCTYFFTRLLASISRRPTYFYIYLSLT